MNVLVYDPFAARLQQTIQALGPQMNVVPVQQMQDLASHYPTCQIAILNEDLDGDVAARLIRMHPMVASVVAMEKKSVQEIRRWMALQVKDCIRYPVTPEALEKVLARQPPVTHAETAASTAAYEPLLPEDADRPQEPVRTLSAVPKPPQPAMPWETKAPSATPIQKEQAAEEPPEAKQERRMVFHQEEPLALPSRLDAPTRQEILAITSSRGGAGKTTLAYNLAALASSYGISTVVIDSDPRGNLAQMSNTEYKYTADNWEDIEEQDGERTVKSLLAPMKCGAFLLPSGRTINGMSEETMTKTIAMLRRHFQLILIDCEPRFTPANLAVYRQANKVLVVTPDEITAFKRTIEKIEQMKMTELDIAPDKIHIVLNRVEKDADKREERFLMERTGCEVLGKLPTTAELRKLHRQGEPGSLQPKLGFAKACGQLLEKVILVPHQGGSRGGSGWFGRMFRKK